MFDRVQMLTATLHCNPTRLRPDFFHHKTASLFEKVPVRSIITYLWHLQKYHVLHWRLYYRLPSPVCIPSQDQTASERKPVKYKITLLLTSHISKDRCKPYHSSYWENKSYLVCGEKIEVIGRVCDHISLARCVWSRTVVSEPARKIFKSLWNTF